MATIYLMGVDKGTRIGVEGEIDPLDLSIITRFEFIDDWRPKESELRLRAIIARLGHQFDPIRRPWDQGAASLASNRCEDGWGSMYIEKLHKLFPSTTAPESG